MAGKCERTDTHVKRPPLTVQRPDNIRSADGLPLAHLNDSTNISQDMREESLQVEADLLVDGSGNAFDAAAAGQAADGGLGDALDVVTEDLSVEWR